MPNVKRTRINPISTLFWTLSLLVLASAASAGGPAPSFALSGKLEQYCCNWPNGGHPPFPGFGTGILIKINDFPFAKDPAGGGLTIQHGFPGPVPTAMGTPSGGFALAASAIKNQADFLNTNPPFFGWISIFTAVNFKNEAGTFMAGGQTGSAAYCLNAAANPNCTNPADGTVGAQPFNGLLSFNAGPNQFGGTMRLLGGTPGYLKRTVNAGARVRLGTFAAPLNQIGGPFSEYQVQTNTAQFWPAATTTGPPTSTQMQQVVFAGIPWGTGTIYAGRTGGTGAVPTQSISGMGTNTLAGSAGGNISLVAASISGTPAQNAFPILIRLSLTLPEPEVTAMLGFGVGFLVLLGVRKNRARAARA